MPPPSAGDESFAFSVGVEVQRIKEIDEGRTDLHRYSIELSHFGKVGGQERLRPIGCLVPNRTPFNRNPAAAESRDLRPRGL